MGNNLPQVHAAMAEEGHQACGLLRTQAGRTCMSNRQQLSVVGLVYSASRRHQRKFWCLSLVLAPLVLSAAALHRVTVLYNPCRHTTENKRLRNSDYLLGNKPNRSVCTLLSTLNNILFPLFHCAELFILDG